MLTMEVRRVSSGLAPGLALAVGPAGLAEVSGVSGDLPVASSNSTLMATVLQTATLLYCDNLLLRRSSVRFS
jgi:hypothetical protein